MAQKMSQIVPVPVEAGHPSRRELPPGFEKLQLQQYVQQPGTTLDVVNWDERKDSLADGTSMSKVDFLFAAQGILLVVLATIDIVFCLSVYFLVDGFRDNHLYNIVDLRIVLLPGIDVTLVVFACLGLLAHISIIVFVECFKKPWSWFHRIMGMRLVLSALPCAVMCVVLMLNAETHEGSPFAALIAILCSTFLWCLHMRLRYSQQLHWTLKVLLDVAWLGTVIVIIIIICLFSTDTIDVLTGSDDDDCDFANNIRMPVYARTVADWFCAPWSTTYSVGVSRTPADNAVAVITCVDTFIGLYGGSIGAHRVRCPQECLASWSGTPAVTGCDFYTIDTPICIAAIHSGALTDGGGEVTVYGRVGVSKFEQCSRYSVISEELTQVDDNAVVTVYPWDGQGSLLAPSVIQADGNRLPQAFHFNVGNAQEFIHLKDFETVPAGNVGVETDKPWTRIEASVSMRIAGMELSQTVIRLGGGGVGEGPSGSFECRAQRTGVQCDAAPTFLIALDFCQPDQHTCLA